jgi:molybdopterin-containing oxidoreductase family iron-sulfur binding subunit
MVIDLKRCIGCYSCMVTCKQEHFLPPGIFFTRLLVGESGEYPHVAKQMYSVMCNHCKSAICVKVCPTGATTRREDGIVVVNDKKCVGCRYCLVACPYQQRTYYDSDGKTGYFPGQGLTELEKIGQDLYPLERGAVVKCTFCVERIEEGLRKGLEPGVDREATPACVNNCPAKARHFGDLNNPGGKVAFIIRQRKGFVLHPEFGTEASVYYVC